MKKNKVVNEIECQQIKKLEQALYDIDFSETSNKIRVEKRVFGEMRGRAEMKMSKRFSLKKLGIIAVAAVSLCGIMQTAVAQEFVGKIIKTIATEHIKVNQDEKVEWTSMPVPEKLKGKLYLEDGSEVTEFTPDMTCFYTADGEKIAHMDAQTGEILTEAEAKKKHDETILTEYDVSKLNNYLCFTAQLPTKLPAGYVFDRAEFYKDENGKVEHSKYLSLYFVDETTGKEIYVQERFADDETAYETGTDGTVEEVEINGEKAILQDERNLDWEADGLLFGISTRNNISKEELLEMARSFK